MEKMVTMQQDELLWKNYNNIGVLHLPKSLRIEMQYKSPFATYEQRPYVCAAPTECFKVQISEIDNQSDFITLKDGVLYSKDMNRLIFCWQEKEYFSVPQSVKVIEPFAFCLQKNLRNIELHNNIVSIGNAAFMGCEALEHIAIPRSVMEIESDTFHICISLKSVELHDEITQIGRHAFRHCDVLQKIVLPQNLKYLNSFECCYSLHEIDIPSSVKEIDGFMFCYNLRKVILHSGVRKIRDYAFRFCKRLATINFPEGLETIGARAFYPSRMVKVIFPNSLKKIETEAFYHNEKLSYIEFLSNVSVEDCAFACCPIIRIKKPDDMILEIKCLSKTPRMISLLSGIEMQWHHVKPME